MNNNDEYIIQEELSATERVLELLRTEGPKQIKELQEVTNYKSRILHSPHRVIQFIALYDTLENMICSHGERLKQKRVHDFFGKYKERYSYIRFHKCNDNPKKSEDTFTHLRNNIAHSKDAGIEEFIKTSNAISNNEIVQILQVINDIISGEVKVD